MSRVAFFTILSKRSEHKGDKTPAHARLILAIAVKLLLKELFLAEQTGNNDRDIEKKDRKGDK